MSINIQKLIDKSPKQLYIIKRQLLSVHRYEDAELVSNYINHCIVTGRLIKELLNS